MRDAIAGALRQTYSPLEIVVLDGASSDRTFAATYRGPHRIVLKRNPRNFGRGAHFNRLVELSTSELIFISAGDDISLPAMCRLVVDA